MPRRYKKRRSFRRKRYAPKKRFRMRMRRTYRRGFIKRRGTQNPYTWRTFASTKFKKTPRYAKLTLTPHRSVTQAQFVSHRSDGTAGDYSKSNSLCMAIDMIGNRSFYTSVSADNNIIGPNNPYNGICDFTVTVPGYTAQSPAIMTGYDYYNNTGENFPYGYRSIYHDHCNILLQLTNPSETDVQVRITTFKLRRNIRAHEWNKDFALPFNHQHYKKYKQETFFINQVTVGGNTATNSIQRNYSFPIKRWKKTAYGDPSNSFDDWQKDPTFGRHYFFFIETNDYSSVDNAGIVIKVVKTDYWKTIETNQQ